MALNKSRLARTIALYKMAHGLAKTFKEGLFENLIKSPFSLNIDEATSPNLHEILTILAFIYLATVTADLVCKNLVKIQY